MENVSIAIEQWPYYGLSASVDGSIKSRPIMIQPAMATPMAINLNQIEYCRGELDKKQYGVRIYFVSGNTLWLPGDTGEKFLATFEDACYVRSHKSTKRSLVDKYNEKKTAK